MTQPDPIPGTKYIEYMPSGISTDYYCKKHKQHVVPIMVARGGDPVPACEYCMWADLDIKSKLELEPVRRRVTMDCDFRDCTTQADAECNQCHDKFCVSHMDDSGYFCLACASGIEAGREEQADDEAPPNALIVDPRNGKLYHISCATWGVIKTPSQVYPFYCDTCKVVANKDMVTDHVPGLDDSEDFESMYDA